MQTHNSDPQIDPEFYGTVTKEIVNNHSGVIRIYPEVKFARIHVFKIFDYTGASGGYHGGYAQADGPTTFYPDAS